jgi:hypothetical protein
MTAWLLRLFQCASDEISDENSISLIPKTVGVEFVPRLKMHVVFDTPFTKHEKLLSLLPFAGAKKFILYCGHITD